MICMCRMPRISPLIDRLGGHVLAVAVCVLYVAHTGLVRSSRITHALAA